MASYGLNEIKAKSIQRVTTGFKELDWLYGMSPESKPTKWGLPKSAISLWAGSSGTGKSRTAIAVAKKMASNGLKILYFQNEVDLGTFSQWVKKGLDKPQNFRVSDETELSVMIQDVISERPDVVFVDSINMVDEFKSGTKTDIQNILTGNANLGFRNVSKKLGIHVIFIAQLNQNGSVKGSSTLPHMVDIALNIERDGKTDGLFCIRVGIKHRFGRTGNKFMTIWQHTENGVDCISQSRLVDPKWMSNHRLIPKKNKIKDPIKRSFFGNKKVSPEVAPNEDWKNVEFDL